MSFKIVALGANPAYQKLTEFEKLRISEVNRAKSLSVLAAGKGQNLARSVNAISPGYCAVAHFLGGATGKWIHDNLTMATGDKIPQIVSWTESQTRTCTTLKDLSSGTVTELIDPSGIVSQKEVYQLLELIKHEMASLKLVAICGTSPPGAESLYVEVSKLAHSNPDCMIYLDGYKKVENVMPFVDVYKVALYELLALTGNTGADKPEKQALTSKTSLFQLYPKLKWIAVTDGPERAYLFANAALLGIETSSWRFTIKPLCADEV